MCIEEVRNNHSSCNSSTKESSPRSSISSEDDCDDHLPIEVSIIGKWLPIASNNTDAYCRVLRKNRYQQILFTSATYNFNGFNTKITETQYIGDEKVSEHVDYLEATQQKNQRLRQTIEVVKNVMKTENFWKLYGKVHLEIVRKFIRNGMLHIENESQGITCTRIYRRVEVFNLAIEYENPIQKELPGLWKMVAFMGIKDFVRGQKLDFHYGLLWEQGIQNIMIKGNTIQVNHFVPDSKPMLHTDMIHTLGKEQVCLETGVQSTSIFIYNSLVTVDTMGKEEVKRTIRYITGGRMFVTVHQELFNFMAVYERV